MIIHKFIIPIYGAIVLISIIIGLFYIYKHIDKEKLDSLNLKILFLLLFSFCIFFSKLFTIVVNHNSLNYIKAGASSYGAAIGFVIAAYVFEKNISSEAKIVRYSIISLPLIYGLSKIACFVSGCCYGIPYNGLLSVTYKNGLNIPLFPVQLLETIVFLIIFFICHKLRNNKNVIYLATILSTISKFLLDYLRYEHLNKILTTNQIVSILLLAGAIILYIIQNRKRESN